MDAGTATPKAETAFQTGDVGNGLVLGIAVSRRPLWVNSGHRSTPASCPLYPQKRTSELACVTCNSSGSLAIFAAIRRASSSVSNLAADRRPIFEIETSTAYQNPALVQTTGNASVRNLTHLSEIKSLVI